MIPKTIKIINFSLSEEINSQLIKLANEQGLFLKEYICIHSKPSKKNIRVIMNFSSKNCILFIFTNKRLC